MITDKIGIGLGRAMQVALFSENFEILAFTLYSIRSLHGSAICGESLDLAAL